MQLQSVSGSYDEVVESRDLQPDVNSAAPWPLDDFDLWIPAADTFNDCVDVLEGGFRTPDFAFGQRLVEPTALFENIAESQTKCTRLRMQ